jgi:hypothetical protein
VTSGGALHAGVSPLISGRVEQEAKVLISIKLATVTSRMRPLISDVTEDLLQLFQVLTVG